MEFVRPPLVEVVATLRWIPTPPVFPGQMVPQVLPGAPQAIFPTPPMEEFLNGFAKEAAKLGWASSERMVPQGMPYFSYQAVLRVRSLDDQKSSLLYQIGPGVFAAHAVLPYKNWDSFLPFAKHGLDALLKTRAAQEQKSPFIVVELRYLNVFTRELVDNISTFRFFTDVMGFGLELPPALKSQVDDESKIEPQLALRMPLRTGSELKLNIVGNATMGDRTGILMDTMVSSVGNVPPDNKSVHDVWENAHSSIQEIFLSLTSKLHSTMQLIK